MIRQIGLALLKKYDFNTIKNLFIFNDFYWYE
jgi:hypothetical protein